MFYIGIFGRTGHCVTLIYFPLLPPTSLFPKMIRSSTLASPCSSEKENTILHPILGLFHCCHSSTFPLFNRGHRATLSPYQGARNCLICPHVPKTLGFVSWPSFHPQGFCSVGQEAKTLTVTCQHLIIILFPSVSFSFPLYGPRLWKQSATGHLFF